MAGGRPRKPGDEICPNPNCGKLGSRFPKHVYKNSSRDLYLYPWFRHSDGSKPCDISKFIKNRNNHRMRIGEEYRRTGDEVITYHVYPKRRNRILENFPLKEVHRNKASPVVIFRLRNEGIQIRDFCGICPDCLGRCFDIHELKCTVCNRTTIVWCPACQLHWDFSRVVSYQKFAHTENLELELKKSNIEKLDLEQINWFLKTKTGKIIGKGSIKFLRKLSKLLKTTKQRFVVTYGDKAGEHGNRISEMFGCDTTYLKDKYRILEKIQKKRIHRDRLQTSCERAYNSPRPTLPKLIDNV